ncbi:serine/threonine protein kinase [Fibrobacter sp. UWB5]|uniref:serine/threonine protein kinase n=1 Tax=Fibrobacter sp. UWB5 TaxID=1964360 RepID=UPI000B52895E|nr:serine/threonine protein kinase [Fibrobacter sp. UWB5]
MSVKSEKSMASILDRACDCALLHQGGEADVYELACGEDFYALKWYHSGCRFEESVVDRLKHLNIPGLYRVRESGVRDNTPYLVYDFIEGVSSADVPAMPVAVALKLLRGVVQTLDALNKEDIHHGDINPSNVLLCKSGNSLQTLVIDCGIVGPGALAYAAPERFQGKPASTQSDLYSLGMLLFRWIAGVDLLESDDYNNLAAQALAIEGLDISSRLYDLDRCKPQELSALEPLWKAMLRESPENRAEDFDELDELLEIALESIGVGEVTAQTALQKYAGEVLPEKMGRKFPTEQKSAFPYSQNDNENKKNTLKIAVLAILGLILIATAFFVLVGTKSPDIDETGNLLLQKSRSLESVESGLESRGNSAPDTLPPAVLKDLPTPVSE